MSDREDLCLIWSMEHQGWWRPGKFGYTPRAAEAGLFQRAEAEAIVAQANVTKCHECLIPLACMGPAVRAGEAVQPPDVPCPAFRPDGNGECLLCDEWIDAHTPEAIAAGETLADACRAQELQGERGMWAIRTCTLEAGHDGPHAFGEWVHGVARNYPPETR